MLAVRNEEASSYTVNRASKHPDVELISLLTGMDEHDIQRGMVERGGLFKYVYANPQLRLCMELATQALKDQLFTFEELKSPKDAVRFLKANLTHRPYEAFCALWLDNRHRVIAFDEMFQGTIDGAPVHPREVVRACLEHNAAAVIFAHNHPSGVAEPSAADRSITETLRRALDLIEVRVLDHLVVGAQGSVSMSERGMI